MLSCRWSMLIVGLAIASPAARAQSAAATDAASWARDSARADALVAELRGKQYSERAVRRVGEIYPLSGTPSQLHARGLLGWRLADPNGVHSRLEKQLDPQWRDLVTFALLAAVRAAPDSLAFRLSLARLQLQSENAAERGLARTEFSRMLRVAHEQGGRAGFAKWAEVIGIEFWNRYQRVASRAGLRDGRALILPEERPEFSLPMLPDVSTYSLVRPSSVPGEAEYQEAEELFRLAADSAPGEPLHSKRLYALLIEKNRWRELEGLAARRIRRDSSDGQAWLASALALHRTERPELADVAFTRALEQLAEATRRELDDLSRILTPADAQSRGQLAPALLTAFDRRSWHLLDPLWITPYNELRLELLARGAQSELRWGFDRPDGSGLRTDLARLFVHFGPGPQIVSSLPDGRGFVPIAWRATNAMLVTFRLPLDGATEPVLSPTLHDTLERVLATRPINWENVPSLRPLPTPVHLARFRSATTDSADLYVAARIPIGGLLEGQDVRDPHMSAALIITDPDHRPILHEQSPLHAESASGSNDEQLRVWRVRVPSGAYVYRVEAYTPLSRRGARGGGPTASVRSLSFPLTGFGMSDVLLAERVESRQRGRPERWTDYAIEPNAGVVRRGQRTALVWETYGLTPDTAGAAHYNIEIAMRRADRAASHGLVAQVIDAEGATHALRPRAKEQLGVGFLRSTRAAATVVDDIRLDLAHSDPGDYVVTLTITDLVSRQSTARDFAVSVAR
jgi:hypothetical protein